MGKLYFFAFFFSICVLAYSPKLSAQVPHRFEIRNGHFLYDGKPMQIHSGEMHFARVPRAYWKHRLQLLKAMGLNTVATYVFWNYHNTAPGVWDFKSENRDLAAFIRTAQEVGLFVILRPGPYACAEWEFGGYPWWLEKDSRLLIRTNNTQFLDSCRQYIKHLAAQVRSLQVTHGGPVIMVQVENEFGSYVAQRKDIPFTDHKQYLSTIKGFLTEAGIDVPLFTSDGSWLFAEGSTEGALPTANGEDNVDTIKQVVNRFHHNEGPYMVAEYYPGWLEHWGEPFPHVSVEEVRKQLKKYLQNQISFNIYMVHGGTNFGFTSGANYDKDHDIQPDLTSYDYDAPISESGLITEKYLAIRDLMKEYAGFPLPAIPEPKKILSLGQIQLTESADLLQMKPRMRPVLSDSVLSFEDLNQGYGYVLYSKTFDVPADGVLSIKGLRDYAVLYINGIQAAVLNRMDKRYDTEIHIKAGDSLDILVENMGRINYGAEIIHNKKGIISPVQINGLDIENGWSMYRFPYSEMPHRITQSVKAINGRPALFFGQFDALSQADAFLDMRGWGKGIVFVNGHNLGRYWKRGPQQTLYLPGPYLKKGKNQIVVFEQLNEGITPSINTIVEPVLNELNP